jgi:hypothetical protein
LLEFTLRDNAFRNKFETPLQLLHRYYHHRA